MSQEKVDKYKQEKANRKKTMAKEKLKKRLYMLAGVLITAIFVAWIGWSVYAENKAKKEQESMIASLQAELNAALSTTNATTTGTCATTGTGETTTVGDTTTSADEKESTENTTEEETTTSADDSKKE